MLNTTLGVDLCVIPKFPLSYVNGEIMTANMNCIQLIILNTTLDVDLCVSQRFWTILLEKYLDISIKNVKEKLARERLVLLTRYETLFISNYYPVENIFPELNVSELQYYQEIIKILYWAIEINRVNILLKIVLLSIYFALPRKKYLQQIYYIFEY